MVYLYSCTLTPMLEDKIGLPILPTVRNSSNLLLLSPSTLDPPIKSYSYFKFKNLSVGRQTEQTGFEPV